MDKAIPSVIRQRRITEGITNLESGLWNLEGDRFMKKENPSAKSSDDFAEGFEFHSNLREKCLAKRRTTIPNPAGTNMRKFKSPLIKISRK